MKTRLLYRYLQRLPEAEWPDFEAFLGSAWMGKSKTYQRFLKEFHAMRFEKREHTVESFHAAVYPNRAYRLDNLKRQLSLMLDRLFAFLAWNEFKTDAIGQQAYLARSLARREWGDAYEKVQGSTSQRFGAEIRNGARLLDVAQAELHQIDLGFHQRQPLQPVFQSAIDALEEAYVLASLDLACKAANVDLFPQKGRLGSRPPHRMPEIVGKLGQPSWQVSTKNALGPILVEIFELYQAPPETAGSHYAKARALLEAAIGLRKESNATMFMDLFTHLVNFAARKVADGEKEYESELLELYHFMLTHGVLLQDGRLDSFHFQNIITAFFKAKKLDWVETFLPQYLPLLPPEEATTKGLYNQALLHFYRNEFALSKSLLREVENRYKVHENVEFALVLGPYLMVMDYECGEFSQIEGRCINYERRVRTITSIPANRRSRYLLFSKFVKKLALLAEKRAVIDVTAEAVVLGSRLAKSAKKPPVLVDWLNGKLDLLRREEVKGGVVADTV